MKKCISCGMDLTKKEDYPLGDVLKTYCIYCANEDGTMISYEEALDEGTKHYMLVNNWDYKKAQEECIRYLNTMSAWKNKRAEKWLY